ncbi:MAG: 4-hydroxy-tetrahydrodipicolinate reductase [Pseudomonadota bacterium]
MSKQLSIAIAGVAGRMGRQLVGVALDRSHTITGGTEQADSPALRTDLGTLAGTEPLGRTPTADLAAATKRADTWIDFTRPAATLTALNALQDTSVKTVIIGTTGFSEAEESAIAAHAKRYAIVKAGNFSLGIALLSALVKTAAARLGPDWDVDIFEAHHRHKVDAPSGTALMLGAAAAAGRGSPLHALRSPPYDGPDAQRKPGEIGFAVSRTGGVIGEHDVHFASETERLTLSHSALDRRVFAEGALKAAEWAANRPAGLYGIEDVLGL